MSELKPCPFCGAKTRIETLYFTDISAVVLKCSNGFTCSVCPTLKIEGKNSDNLKRDLIERWNKRISKDDLCDKLAEALLQTLENYKLSSTYNVPSPEIPFENYSVIKEARQSLALYNARKGKS